MLTVYLLAVAFGGTLLGASLVLGGKDTDHGDGHEGGGHDGDADGDADHADGHSGFDKAGLGDALGWVPVSSLRFWTFLLAFGGAVGAILTYFGLAHSLVVGATSLAVGWVSGVGSVAVVRALKAGSADSSTVPDELVGATGQLLLGAGPGEPGKVRLDVKGRVQDFVAVTEDEQLPTGATVLVVSSQADGRLVVSKGDDS